jgi:hypothetical protein
MATPSLEPQQYRDQQLRLEPPASRRTASGVGDQGDVATRLGVTVEDQCHEEKHVPSARPAIPTPVSKCGRRMHRRRPRSRTRTGRLGFPPQPSGAQMKRLPRDVNLAAA